jgi:hypothetical protein
MRLLHLTIALGLTFGAMAGRPAFAQPQPRIIPAESGTPWVHTPTKLVLPAAAAGLTRGEIGDTTASELDVSAQYQDQASDLLVLVYVYRPGIPDVGIWFEQAASAMGTSPGHGMEGAILPAPTPFARPGAGTPSGLRLSMDVPGPGFKSTALAVAPLGNWLVKVHMSSRSLDGAALGRKMDAVLAALGWPAEAGAPRAAAPMLPCPAPLKTRQAKIARDDMADVLMNAVSSSIEREGPPPVYCREPGVSGGLAVYRPDGDDNSYIVALDDAGLALSVAPSLSALLGGSHGKKYSLTRLQHGGADVLPSFTRLPPPEQAVSVAQGSSPMMRSQD